MGLVVLVVAMGVGLSGCDFDKKLNTSYTLHLWDDIYGGDAKLASSLGHPLSRTVRQRWVAASRGR